MAAANKGIFIIGAKRTPFCKYGGPLRELQASYAFAAAAKDAIKTAKLNPSYIDNTVVGNVNFLSQCDGGKTPRYCGIYSGVPISSPALGVNKACGSGLQAIITSGVDILTGVSKITLTGGTEIMSSLPMLVRNVRFGTALGTNYLFEDHMKVAPDSYTGKTILEMSEELAKKFNVKREEADEFALNSHLKWKTAQESNIFKEQLTNLTVTIKDVEIDVNKDDMPNPSLKYEEIKELPAFFEDGILNPGNTYRSADGAAALVLAHEGSLPSHNLRPLARLAGWACVAVDPMDTGIAPVTAIRKLLDEQRLKMDDIDLFEINESFASQVVITANLLDIDISKVNVSGGSLALGHPASATGARMAVHLVHELGRRNLKRAIATSSCGVGQAVAILLENV